MAAPTILRKARLLSRLAKHGTHDQSTHGNWAHYPGSPAMVRQLLPRCEVLFEEYPALAGRFRSPEGLASSVARTARRMVGESDFSLADIDELEAFELVTGSTPYALGALRVKFETMSTAMAESGTDWLNRLAKHYGPGPHQNGTPQDVHGSWSTDTDAESIKERALDGGFTVSPITGEVPTSGFAVALPGYEAHRPVSEVTEDWISEHRARAWSQFEDIEGARWGGWYDEESGEIFLDVSIVLDDRDAAIELGRKTEQLAIADLSAITRGDWENAFVDTGGRTRIAARRDLTMSLSDIKLTPMSKHYGPIHPGTGTSQAVHAPASDVGGASLGPGPSAPQPQAHGATTSHSNATSLDSEVAPHVYLNKQPLPEGMKWVRTGALPEVTTRVERLASRAKRYFHIEDPIHLVVTDRTHTHVDSSGMQYNWVAVRLEGTPPTVPGYEFAASVEHTENEDGTYTNIVKKVPAFEGEIPVKYRNAGPNCELCNRKIYRRDTFLVRNVKTGEWKQLGRDDLKAYTGADNAEDMAKYARVWGEASGILEGGDDFDIGGGGGEVTVNSDHFLAMTAAVMRNDGGMYRKTSEFVSTKSMVEEQLFGRNLKPNERISITEEDETKARQVHDWLESIDPETIPASNDYVYNLRTIITSPYGIRPKNFGIAASAISAYNREMGLQEGLRSQAEANAASEWIGEVGKPIEGVFAVERAYVVDGYTYGSYATHVDATDEKGNYVYWKASDGYNWSPGDRFSAKFTVKAHDTDSYKGRDNRKRTVITRPRNLAHTPKEQWERAQSATPEAKTAAVRYLDREGKFDAKTDAELAAMFDSDPVTYAAYLR